MIYRRLLAPFVLCLFVNGCGASTSSSAANATKTPPADHGHVHAKREPRPRKTLTARPRVPQFTTLKINSQSPSVATLQRELDQLGYYSYAGVTGYYGMFTAGAVMTFQAQHGFPTNGIATPALQRLLATDVRLHKRNALGEPYRIIVRESIPERLSLYRGTRLVLSSLCNTGIAGARTPLGSFPVYQKFVSQTMTGVNPNGTHYTDPGIPWIMYFYQGGFAVHGFIRAQYGFPQSVGCVELPPPVAKQIFSRIPIGTIVTVESGPAV